jgi:hypothetical protein
MRLQTLKKSLLIILLTPFISFIPLQQLDWSRNKYYNIVTISASVFVLLINLPIIVKQIHSRPIYYDDLEDTRFINTSVRKRFQLVFIFILQITLTCITAGLVYYYHDRLTTTNLSSIELFGVFGGFISLLLKIENIIGKLALTVINMLKSRDCKPESHRSKSLEFFTEV